MSRTPHRDVDRGNVGGRHYGSRCVRGGRRRSHLELIVSQSTEAKIRNKHGLDADEIATLVTSPPPKPAQCVTPRTARHQGMMESMRDDYVEEDQPIREVLRDWASGERVLVIPSRLAESCAGQRAQLRHALAVALRHVLRGVRRGVDRMNSPVS
jgi:hypothetical protein